MHILPFVASPATCPCVTSIVDVRLKGANSRAIRSTINQHMTVSYVAMARLGENGQASYIRKIKSTCVLVGQAVVAAVALALTLIIVSCIVFFSYV
jgi:hypothetical protein